MKNNSLKEIWNKIIESNNILMSLHSAPDGDSLGSCLAMKYISEKFEKKVKVISKDFLPANLQTMQLSKEIEFNTDITEINLEEFNLLLCIDTPKPEMIGKFKKNYVLPKNIFSINIDHHPTNPFYADMNYVEENQPSACSVLIDLFKENKIEFDAELSTRLLIGLCTDAGFFTFASTAEKAIEQASFLIKSGGEYTEKVLAPIMHNQPLNLMKYYALLIMKLKFNNEMNYAYSITTAEEIKRLKLNKVDVRLGANHLQYLKEYDFIFTLSELDDEIKGSFRSQKGVDVSLFAKELGGGGHKAAAAFVFPKISLEKAEKKVIDAIKKVGIQKIKN